MKKQYKVMLDKELVENSVTLKIDKTLSELLNDLLLYYNGEYERLAEERGWRNKTKEEIRKSWEKEIKRITKERSNK